MFAQSASAIERAAAVRNFVAATGAAGQGAGDRRDTTADPIAAPLTADHWRDVLQHPDRGICLPR